MINMLVLSIGLEEYYKVPCKNLHWNTDFCICLHRWSATLNLRSSMFTLIGSEACMMSMFSKSQHFLLPLKGTPSQWKALSLVTVVTCCVTGSLRLSQIQPPDRKRDTTLLMHHPDWQLRDQLVNVLHNSHCVALENQLFFQVVVLAYKGDKIFHW